MPILQNLIQAKPVYNLDSLLSPQGPRPAPSTGHLQSTADGTDDCRFRALLPWSGTEGKTKLQRPPPFLSNLCRAPPTGPSGNRLGAGEASLSLCLNLRLRNATECPALAQTQPLLGLAFFGVTLTHCWGGTVIGILPSPGPPPLLQRLRLQSALGAQLQDDCEWPGDPRAPTFRPRGAY